MSSFPSDAQLWQAIDAYLRHAYPAGKIPAAVQARLDLLRSAGGSLMKSSAFESVAGAANKRTLRLGNGFFPHMKLVVERRGNNDYFFRADAHDAHCRPADGSCEMSQYQELVGRNRELITAIESEWAELGLPTFKTFLRDDLASRRNRASS